MASRYAGMAPHLNSSTNSFER